MAITLEDLFAEAGAPEDFEASAEARAAFSDVQRRFRGSLAGKQSDQQREFQEDITDAFVTLAFTLVWKIPASRHLAIALTHLEDAKMRAVAAIYEQGVE